MEISKSLKHQKAGMKEGAYQMGGRQHQGS